MKAVVCLQERLYWLQRQCRRVTLVLALLVLGVCIYLYKDISAINNRLLVEIRRQNSDLWRFVTGNFQVSLEPEFFLPPRTGGLTEIIVSSIPSPGPVCY